MRWLRIDLEDHCMMMKAMMIHMHIHPVALFPLVCNISKQAQNHQGAAQPKKKGVFLCYTCEL